LGLRKDRSPNTTRGVITLSAIKVVALDDHIAEIDADAQLDAAVRCGAGVAFGHRLLHGDGTAHRIASIAGAEKSSPTTVAPRCTNFRLSAPK
jgi:hypothetical protein